MVGRTRVFRRRGRSPMMPRMSLLRALVIVAVLLVGGGYTWLQTPSYSIYRIQQALRTRDHAAFRRYVDLDSVVGHAVSEVGGDLLSGTREPPRRGLAGLLQKGVERLVENVPDLARVTTGFAVRQAFDNPDQRLPDIPLIAVVGALLVGETRDGVRYLPVTLRSGEEIEIGLRANPDGVWRVVRVTRVKALLDEFRASASS